ncbi:unnamed protein product [Musa acuminata var. zebrina]
MWAQAAGVNVSASTDSFFSHPTIKGYHKDYVLEGCYIILLFMLVQACNK